MTHVNFFAYGTLRYGAQVTAGDLDGDGRDEIITGAGPGVVFGPHVRGWSVINEDVAQISAVSFIAYGTHTHGVNVACGDLDGDGLAEIVTAPGPGPGFGAHIRGWQFDGETVAPLAGCDFLAFDYQTTKYGAVVTCESDWDHDGRSEFLICPGPDSAANSTVKVFHYTAGHVEMLFSKVAFPDGYGYGAKAVAGQFTNL